MATIQDLTDWVDVHPDDHEQRWWLAKKLYKNSEYEAALEHLLVLKEKWKPKLNIARYLAASYYRLGKYPESIAELEQAVEQWPEEIPVREQLARVLEIAGRKEGAARVWREVLKLKPAHPMAEQALNRLPKITPPPKSKGTLKDDDFGIKFGTGKTCDKCGALNTEEHEDCWKCSEPLYKPDAQVLKPQYEKDRAQAAGHNDEPGHDADTDQEAGAFDVEAVWNTAGSVATAVMLALGVFLSLRQWTGSAEVARTVREFWASQLLPTRVSMGAALIVGWPIALWAGLTAARVGEIAIKPVIVSGLLFASSTFVALSLPLNYIGATLVVVLALSLGPVMLLFDVDFWRSLGVWCVQCLLIAAILAAAFGAMEGAQAIVQLPAALKHAGSHDTAPAPGVYHMPEMVLPARSTVRWAPTGSAWLDRRAGRTEIRFFEASTTRNVNVTLTDEAGTVLHNEENAVPFRFRLDIVPGTKYSLDVTGTEGAVVKGTVYGPIKAVFR